jgi:alpha-tubulin suppressor-like RCC1 family protein
VESWILGPAGVHSLRAIVEGLESQPVSFSATAVAPVPVAFVTGNNQTGFAGDTLTKEILFRLVTVQGVPRAGVTVTFTAEPGNGTFTETSVVTDANGSGSTRWILGPNSGSQTATATAPDQGDGILKATAVRFVSVSAAGSSACGLSSDGAAYCWGSNFLTQLGDGSTVTLRTRATRVAGLHVFEKLESAGEGNFSCGIKTGGAAWCWGSARHGQLGDGTLPMGGGSSSSVPIAVAGGISFSSIEPGGDFACGLDQAGKAYCWGENFDGQLGDGSTVDHGTPEPAAAGFNFIQLATGFDHACGLTSTGDTYCWGNRSPYQAGTIQSRTTPILIPGGNKFVSIVAGGIHTCGLKSSGAAFCWGQNSSGQVGDGSTSTRASPVAVLGGISFVMLAGQGRTTCGLTAAGSAYCWGENDNGEAGVGNTSSVRTPKLVDGGIRFTSLTVGHFTSCGVADSGAVWCWGPNSSGQVGDGTLDMRVSPTRVGF